MIVNLASGSGTTGESQFAATLEWCGGVLIGDDGRFVTGQTIVVDGGQGVFR